MFSPVLTTVNTKNGEFGVTYLGDKRGSPFKVDFGYLFVTHNSSTAVQTFKVDEYDKNRLYLTKNGVTEEYSKGDPLISVQYTSKFICGCYLLKPFQ
ncbi:hypothetical protein J4411_02210 [Candidatus Pacearchaeota archaeon]|nr:hypothetical protein [Candidatus Pacearchaeota archaeon]OGM74189.1 MAG: hypothetical protein A2191_04005 [Candidatus Woesebacteria bacterium RIFOXYA1_FULL_38_9]